LLREIAAREGVNHQAIQAALRRFGYRARALRPNPPALAAPPPPRCANCGTLLHPRGTPPLDGKWFCRARPCRSAYQRWALANRPGYREHFVRAKRRYDWRLRRGGELPAGREGYLAEQRCANCGAVFAKVYPYRPVRSCRAPACKAIADRLRRQRARAAAPAGQ
jgi:hypothetical protein